MRLGFTSACPLYGDLATPLPGLPGMSPHQPLLGSKCQQVIPGLPIFGFCKSRSLQTNDVQYLRNDFPGIPFHPQHLQR